MVRNHTGGDRLRRAAGRIFLGTVLAAGAACGRGEARGREEDAGGPPAAAEEVSVTAELSEWKVALSRDTVPAGQVTFRVTNTGKLPHALVVEGEGVDRLTNHLQAGETTTLRVTLPPGTYEVYCPVKEGTDHSAVGMHTSLVVRGR
ncbi:MAG TPA: cupredoxin domain-containing protein [Longimicrobiaceae bacterium]|nr:cupredoxin domain-containing protein [Longimicrobiaceae bacterium]